MRLGVLGFEAVDQIPFLYEFLQIESGIPVKNSCELPSVNNRESGSRLGGFVD